MKFSKRILILAACLCAMLAITAIQANADSVPTGFSFDVKLADSSTYRCYDGGDTSGTLSVSSMSGGSGSYSGGTITATNSGNFSTIQLKESGSFKNAEYILVPFTMSVKVPAYTAYTVDTKIQLSMNRNAKGSTWYVFEWTGNTNNAAYGKSFSTKMDLETTDGFVYRAYGNDKSYTPTEQGTLVFDNRKGTEAKTITHQYAIFVGNSKSGSLLKSYHHQLETSLTLTPTSVTATKVIKYYDEDTYVAMQQSSNDSITISTSKPSKTGHVFKGWLGSDGKTYQPGEAYTGKTGLTLTAKWIDGKSIVTFNANEGAVSTASKEVRIDSPYGELPTPTRDYYTFLGWYTAASGGSKVTKDTIVTKTENHALYAHWMNKTAYVKLDPNGGSPSSSGTVNAGTTLGTFIGNGNDPTRNDYNFAGWYTEKTGGTQVYKDTIISESVTYYAHWIGKESTVTLKYNDNSRADGEITVNYGGTYSGLTDPTRNNYKFDGWYTATSGGSKVTSSTTVTAKENHILYARWTRNTANIKFMDGTDTFASRTVNAGDVLGELPAPTKTGYEFKGWYTEANDGAQVTNNTTASVNATYYAHWTASKYTVTFDKNDGVAGESDYDTKSIAYGSPYTLPDTPTRTGYKFNGWFTEASGGTQVTSSTTLPRAEAHTLYAQWERIVYTVTFKNGTTTVETRKVNAEDKLGTLPTTTKTGYTFNGWYTDESGETNASEETVISSDVTCYAQWTANSYTITFNPNGGTVTDGTKTLTYGNTLGVLPTPTRTGYKFEGWYTAVTGGTNVTESTKLSTAANTTYYARWTANEYIVTFDANGGTLSGDSSATVAYGGTYGTLPTATKTGCNFVGWYTDATNGTQVTASTVMTKTSSHTLYARYAQKHEHAVAPDGKAVEFTALTQEYINDLTSTSASIGTASFNYITLPAGNYYLTEDITTTYSIWLTGNVNLCFNGHAITSTFTLDEADSNVSAVMPIGSCQFDACDCQGGGGFTCEGQYVITTYKGTQDKCTVALYGGTFSGKNTIYVNSGKTLIVDGATVKATSIAINAQSGAKVTIKSGLVTSDNSASDTSVATIQVYATNVTIEGGTITNTGTSNGYSVRIGSTNETAVKLSGGPVIKGTAGDFSITNRNAKIEVADDLTGVYTVNVNGTVSKRSAWTMTTESNRDVTSHFVAKSSNIVLQDVVGNEGKHTVQIYTSHKHTGVEWNYARLDTTEVSGLESQGQYILEDGGQYILVNNSEKNLTIPANTTVDLCLNGKTLTGKITVNGTLNLYDCKKNGEVINNTGSNIEVTSTGTLNYYGGKLTGGNDNDVPIYADGTVNLYATPTISTECDYEIHGNSQGFLHICKTLTTKPSKALRVNFGTDDSVKIADKKQVVVTSGWSTYMSGKTLEDYFAPRANRTAKIDTNEDGELILRLLRVTIDGDTYYPAYSGGKITSLPATPKKTGYIWNGYYTSESGGDKVEISTSTEFEDDMTLYSQWTECDHTGNANAVTEVPATCTTAGSEKYTCSVCALTIEKVIDTLGHDYNGETWTNDNERGTHYHACTRTGCDERIDEAEHTWNEAATTNATCTDNGSVEYKCTACSATRTETIPALGHDYSDAWLNDETNHWHKCSQCSSIDSNAAHEWDEGVVTTEATTESDGVKTYTCGVCGSAKTETIDKLPTPEPTKYTVTYQKDEYTVGDVPTQAAADEGESITLPNSGLTRAGYTFADWALLDENGKAENTVRTGEFTMPERDVTFVVRWTRVANYNLSSVDIIVLEDGTVVARDGETVTIKQGGSETVNTTITLPDGSSTVTLKNDDNKDKIIVPAGSTVTTGDTTITISGGNGTVDITGAVEAPVGSSVTDRNGNTVTIKSGNGRIDTDGTVSFPTGSGGKVTVTDKNNNTTTVDVPTGSEGVTVTENGTPLVDNGNNGVTIVSKDGTTTTITIPDNEDASIDETDSGVTVPAGSTITTKKDGATTTTTIEEGTGKVASDGKVTLPDGGKVTIKDNEGKETTSTVDAGGSVDLAHTHSWSADWKNDNTHHWHECSADNCPVKVNSEKNGYAEHNYDKEVATNQYLASAATCTAKATYYKSCVCGKKGTETFESGNALGHSMTRHAEVSATCKTTGNVEYWSCSICNKNFNDEAGTTELEYVVTGIDAAHHAGTATTWTKTETTHEEKYDCCGAVKTAKENHEWNDGVCSECYYECQHSGATDDGDCTTALVCGVCNKTLKAEKSAHTWSAWTSNGDGTHTHSCTTTGCNVTETANCSGGEATCTSKAVCTTCNTAYGDIDANNHSWASEFKVDVNATCTNAGSQSKHCTREGCDARSDVTTILALGHEYGGATYTWSSNNEQCTAKRVCTCSECGHDDSQTVTATVQVTQAQSCINDELSTYTATFTNAAFSTQTKTDVKTKDKLGHDYTIQQHDETQHWNKCSRCEAINEKVNHSGGTATCTSKAVCTTCQTAYGNIDANKHTGEKTWTKTPTTHEQKWSCCNAIVVASENHEWNNNGVCSECGYACLHSGATDDGDCTTALVCDVCNKTLKAAESAHSWGRYTVTTAATVDIEGIETRSCLHTGCTEKQTRTIAKLTPTPVPTPTYIISGEVKNSAGASANNVSVALVLGDRQIAATTTDANGKYTFSGVEPGVYNLVATGEDKVTMTVKIEIASSDVTVTTITMPAGNTSSVVEVKSEATEDKRVEAVVGNLEKIFEDSSDKTVYNAEDKAKVDGGGSVEIKLTVTQKDEEKVAEKITEELKTDARNNVGMRLDLEVQKTVTTNEGETTVNTITNTGVLLETVIKLPTQLQGKRSYTVYRLHGDVVQALTMAKNTDGEYIEISSDRKTLTIHAKYYSEYVIAYQEKSSSGGGNTAAYEVITPVQPDEGGILVSPTTAKSGETVTITLKPEEGYEADTVTVLDKDGKAIEITDKGDGTYTFKMPIGDVSVSATFKKASDKGTGYVDCPKDATCPIDKFVDAQNTEWYHDGIHYCLDEGLMKGMSDVEFAPSGNVTRAQIVTILWRTEGGKAVDYLMKFKDVESDSWYEEAIRWAASEAIVTGYNDREFGPNDSITREQMAAIMYRYAKYKGMDVTGDVADIDKFSDNASVSAYALDAIKWAVGSQIINGTTETTLSPKGTATRAQAASIMQRFLAENK